MKAWLHEGDEAWFDDITGDPVVTGYGGGTWEIVFPSKHGKIEVMLEPGEPECEFDVEAFRKALNRRFEERKAKREMEDAE